MFEKTRDYLYPNPAVRVKQVSDKGIASIGVSIMMDPSNFPNSQTFPERLNFSALQIIIMRNMHLDLCLIFNFSSECLEMLKFRFWKWKYFCFNTFPISAHQSVRESCSVNVSYFVSSWSVNVSLQSSYSHTPFIVCPFASLSLYSFLNCLPTKVWCPQSVIWG